MCPCDKERQCQPGCICQQVKEGNPYSLLSTDEARPGVLNPVLGFPVQEKYRHTGSSPKKDHEGSKGNGVPFM